MYSDNLADTDPMELSFNILTMFSYGLLKLLNFFLFSTRNQQCQGIPFDLPIVLKNEANGAWAIQSI